MSRPAMLTEHPLLQLETLEVYRHGFTDADLWRPYVTEVCRRHALLPAKDLRPGLAGSFPTFIVAERWVVKLFGRLFEGGLSFETECYLGQAFAQAVGIPVPRLLASGTLFENPTDWRWPYLIFEFIPGNSIGEVYDQIPLAEKHLLARDLGNVTRHLHQLPLTSPAPRQLTFAYYTHLLKEQHRTCENTHRQWKTLPDHLISQIPSYLLPLDNLVDKRFPPCLIHADLTRDHILGRLEQDRWVTHALIDFGDAMVANLLYELIALHLDLFGGDRRLLRSYLEAYGLDEHFCRSLPRQAMCMTLLHRFDVLAPLLESQPQWKEIASLEQLATLLWDVITLDI